MSKTETELFVNFSNMEDEELLAFKVHIEQKYSEICENNIMEYAKLMQDENFDQYSFLGKRKINKMLDKHAKDEEGFEVLMQELLKEIKQRQLEIDDVEMNQEFDKLDSMSDEEFIKYQMEKSEKFKNKKN